VAAPARIAREAAQQRKARLAVEAQRGERADAGGEARLDAAQLRRAQEDDDMAPRAHQP
jgi:hypothetical protein